MQDVVVRYGSIGITDFLPLNVCLRPSAAQDPVYFCLLIQLRFHVSAYAANL